jgi:short-subunit dehydrogenase
MFNRKLRPKRKLMNIVITGASTGIGKAIAEIFAAQGHNLFICSRNEFKIYKALEDLMNRFPQSPCKARAVDLAKIEEVKAFGEWVLSFGIKPDVLVNNAGQFFPGSIATEQDGVLEQMMAVNLYGAYHLTRTLLPSMIEAGSGHIVNICSIASLKAYPNGGSYSISKYAMAGFSQNLREELKSLNIKVTAVYPGAAYTDSWAKSEIERSKFMEAGDIATMVYAATQLSSGAVAEDIILRPQKGDIED